MKYSPGEKHEIIRMVEGSSLGVRKTLRQIGVSKSTFYEWYRRYVEDGLEGLKDRTRCPRQFWNRIPESVRIPLKVATLLSLYQRELDGPLCGN